MFQGVLTVTLRVTNHQGIRDKWMDGNFFLLQFSILLCKDLPFMGFEFGECKGCRLILHSLLEMM